MLVIDYGIKIFFLLLKEIFLLFSNKELSIHFKDLTTKSENLRKNNLKCQIYDISAFL